MPEQKIEQFNFGGVDSRSNPANFPSGRAIRMKNFRPLYSGQLRLRYGYTAPTMQAVDSDGGAVHSAAYYEQFAGSQFVIYGQGTSLLQLSIPSGVVTNIATFTSGNSWGHFRASNRIFIGNGTDAMVSFDGTTLRPAGIRAPTTAEAASVTTAVSATPGTWAITVLNGYQLYMVYFNPITGAVGNRIAIGGRLVFTGATSSADVAGLPNLSGVNAEWVVGLGATNDNGEVPYWLVDASGNRIVVPNGSTTANIPSFTIDTTQELPTRNGVPPSGLNKFAKVGSRIWAARPGDLFLYYTEDATDTTNGDFVGDPYESWAGNNVEAYPTGEVPAALHAYRFEGWFFSKTHLSIWSLFLFQQGVNPWRGPWPVGCAGQRAWVETPYGPFWVTPDKELMKFNLGGPQTASEEYQATLLSKIADQYVSQIEVAYLRDPEKHIDCVYVLGKDATGANVVVIHDFKIKDERAPDGQAYEAAYSGMTPSTLAGTGYTPRQNVRDANGRERLWCGDTLGRLYQLEDGTSDNNNTYTGDCIDLVYVGPNNAKVNSVEFQGDPNLQFSYSVKPTLALADMKVGKAETIDAEENRFEVPIDGDPRWIFGRIQLTSHPADGNFDITDPPFMPFPWYGLVNYATAKMGPARVGR